MIRLRCVSTNAPPVTTRPPLGTRAKSATARSISAASLTSTGVNSTPNEGATDWMAANWPIPAETEASRMTATRVTPGANSLSSSSHFPLSPNSRGQIRWRCRRAAPGCRHSRRRPDRRRLQTRSARYGSPAAASDVSQARSNAYPRKRTSGLRLRAVQQFIERSTVAALGNHSCHSSNLPRSVLNCDNGRLAAPFFRSSFRLLFCCLKISKIEYGLGFAMRGIVAYPSRP